ncbi:hypothetical protein DFH28DRAFT_1128205 [Melampsora americana]|nr:hypothetical protein DFH28DRAFT_1128205 [Melampsora americana]
MYLVALDHLTDSLRLVRNVTDSPPVSPTLPLHHTLPDISSIREEVVAAMRTTYNQLETHQKVTQQFTKSNQIHSNKAPTDSEESVRAEKDDKSIKTLKKETIKEIHQTQTRKN